MSEDRIEFAPNDEISEWLPEIEQWLKAATGKHVRDVMLTDESDLRDMLEHQWTGEWSLDNVPFRKEKQWLEVHDVMPEAWQHVVGVFAWYEVNLRPQDDTTLIALAKRTYESRQTS